MSEHLVSAQERNSQDQSSPLGIATTRFEERAWASTGLLPFASPLFESNESLSQAGVLFALPALMSQGLFDYRQIYSELKNGYYGFDSVMLTLAFMALWRIKNSEQIKQNKVGELGRVLGLDRIPETKCLRKKIKEIEFQNKAKDFNALLFDKWLDDTESIFFYVDGHVRVYHGHKAKLTSKYVSRQKLCLAATTEFWVNDDQGMPYLVITGELSEKLQDVILTLIIPELLKLPKIKQRQQKNEAVLFTLVFDREAYSPSFFMNLWTRFKIAVITYRKNVKDKWNETLFKPHEIQVIGNTVNKLLYEQNVILNEHTFKEVRCLGKGGHQTAIITTNPQIDIKTIASKMFSRWSQENFFRYMIADYDLDKMISYEVETVNEKKMVVNPQYRQLTYNIKKLKEKKTRLEAKFYPTIEKMNKKPIDFIPKIAPKMADYKEKIQSLKNEIDELKTKRLTCKSKIKLMQMPIEKRFNKLKPESKLFMNIIKMICYRAETALTMLIAPYFKNEEKEKRMLIKQIFNSPADLIPDYANQTLTVRLYSLSAPRCNVAVSELCKLLNETETVFPNTNLRLIFKTTAS